MLVKPEELDTIIWMIKGANPEDAPKEIVEEDNSQEGSEGSAPAAASNVDSVDDGGDEDTQTRVIPASPPSGAF